MDAKAFTRKKLINAVFSLSSSYMDEGKIALGQEFGKDSGVYFSILASIASGRTSYAEIRNVVGAEIGGLLFTDFPSRTCKVFNHADHH